MTKVLFLVGSLRKGSFVQQFAKAGEKALEGKAEVSCLDLSTFPLFNQDLETPVLPEIAAARQLVSEADAIWIFSPTYNFAIPGVVKNALDWLSRALDLSDPHNPSILHDKFSTVSILANGGHEQAAAQYRALLPFIRTQFINEVTMTKVNDSAWMDGQFIPTEEVVANLEKQADALLAAIEKGPVATEASW
ncbi:NAD(P)H-dependent oxidoreductase [Streptococcus sp. X16XC17]|uniref:NADPH-dependent FMN reductase n=1 Tax=unclassified Streptococcus TaxID=2608887 RepID=UPI00066FD639|nr:MULTISPECIES: NADPH-dependent FMN reductase [unclassified Streptococcus]TCD46195.1 NAD(P)H-dependent oxidoreductase [Streptococcus sp. X16XC17]